MKRFVLGCLVVLCLVAVAPAAALASGPKLKAFLCQSAVMPVERAMSIIAVMPHVPRTARFAMKFQLLKRTRRHGQTTSVAGTLLNSWLTPKPSTLGSRPGDVWIVKHPVVDLPAPAYYRFKVTFRWLDASGGVIAQKSLRSPVCFQPELRPDLKVVQTSGIAGDPGHYFGLVRNTGPTASSKFSVEVSPSGGTTPLVTSKLFDPLAPHASQRVSLHGAACTPGQMLTITVNPSDPADDSNPSDNVLTATCPASPAGPARARRGRQVVLDSVAR